MQLHKSMRTLFFLLGVSLFQNMSHVCVASSFEPAEQLSALVAVPAIWAERSYENEQGVGAKKMAKISKVFADIVRLASGALTLKNQYDNNNEALCVQQYKYTALWLLIDAVKLGMDILPESFLEQLIAIFPDDALKNIDEVCLTDFEKSVHQFFSTDKFSKRARITFLPGVEITTLLVLALTKNEDQNVKFYASGIKGLCRSLDEYLGATNTTMKRLFLILFVAHLTSLAYDGFMPPAFKEKNALVRALGPNKVKLELKKDMNHDVQPKAGPKVETELKIEKKQLDLLGLGLVDKEKVVDRDTVNVMIEQLPGGRTRFSFNIPLYGNVNIDKTKIVKLVDNKNKIEEIVKEEIGIETAK